jgi:hypothetical protein
MFRAPPGTGNARPAALGKASHPAGHDGTPEELVAAIIDRLHLAAAPGA